ncbi:kelch-like protein 21 [Saccostrea cucullata]|uniref:kelch-like protein 21 n=1 Tax=Saccostrea cuccullata TaxID=36930 RepID=UPI002ED20E05
MAETKSECYSDDDGFPETDVTLLVEDKIIHVNKAVLSQHSPVFSAMFSGSFKESTEKEITLKNKKAKDFIEFLRCFYPNMKHAITEQNVLRVLPLAHEYQSPLVTDCEKFMASMCKPGTRLTVTTLLDYIIAAEKYDLNTFLDTAVEFCGHVEFDLLNGRTFERKEVKIESPAWPICPISVWIYDVQEMKDISSKFLEIDSKTQHAISVRRLHVLEMNERKKKNLDDIEEDYVIKLS